MDQGTSTLLGAAIGAFAGISGGILLEAFKRRQDRRGVAMALAGAIEMELWAIERRGHVQMFRGILERFEAGKFVAVRGLAPEDQARNPIADAFTEKFGMLPGRLPARVIQFFQTMWGLRLDAARVVSGHFGENVSLIAAVIRQDLDIMAEMQVMGRQLALDLRASADGFWAPVSRVWRDMTERPI